MPGSDDGTRGRRGAHQEPGDRDAHPQHDGRARHGKQHGHDGHSPERHAIARLLRERGIARHALFLTQREGMSLPGGLEAVSGFVLEPSGRVHGFWLAWDEQRQAPTLAPFYGVEDAERAFAEDAEYLAARRALGLS